MHVCFVFVSVYSILSQEIGWEERLGNDLFCVEWDVKPKLSQSMCECHFMKWKIIVEL